MPLRFAGAKDRDTGLDLLFLRARLANHHRGRSRTFATMRGDHAEVCRIQRDAQWSGV